MGKAKHDITNWAVYNRALVSRGSLTFWMDEAATRPWHCQQHHGGRGRGFEYSDTTIETALMLKGLFGLPLWALEGFINSLFQLMALPLTSPIYSCIRKRAKMVNIHYRLPSKGPVAHLAPGSRSMAKVSGSNASTARKKRRVWRKLHLAVDAQTHEAIAAEVSLENVGDSEVLPGLLNPLRRRIDQVSADVAYDKQSLPPATAKKTRQSQHPAPKNSGVLGARSPKERSSGGAESRATAEWERESSYYHQRSKAETAMSRYKQLISPKLSLRNYNGQVA
ncbi:IS5 family transposase [Aeromonas caviae]|uniref:IS5 family transposase n=1 Tax=Aeromonas caviae TaxID=648 RepID=UPI001F2C330D|nr:IS5 family transposase [Aeromonas caviae]